MSTGTKIIAATLACLFLAIAVGALIWLSSAEKEVPVPDTATTAQDLRPPSALPGTWSGETEGDRLVVDLRQGPRWETEAGGELFAGPLPRGGLTEWEVATAEEWKVLLGRSTEEGVDLNTHIWSAPGAPVVIIDITAQIEGDALAQQVAVTTSHHLARGTLITSQGEEVSLADPPDSVEILGAMLRSDFIPMTIQSMGAAHGIARPTQEGLGIDWVVWPGVDDAPACDATAGGGSRAPSVAASLRLVIQFGANELAQPRPERLGWRAAATPIFVDAPAHHGDPWLDGSARDATDLAGRLRALAFGHSNRDDPRYGNGGLLAAGLGATFAIPAKWWGEAPIAQLRRSLEGTKIEILPLHHQITDEAYPIIFTDNYCDRFPFGDDDQSPTMLVSTEEDRPFEMGLLSPIPPVIEVGMGPVNRRRLLDRLFEPNGEDSLFVDGEYRVQRIPVVATRNPLEDIAGQAILSPERLGHWTLDDALNRRLTAWEFDDANSTRRALGFQALKQSRNQVSPEFAEGLAPVQLVFTPQSGGH